MREMDKEAEIFKALAHPFRLQLLQALRAGEVCVCHLTALTGKPQPYVSKQLAELRDVGLVLDRREGLRIYYRLDDPAVGSVIDTAQLVLLRQGALSGADMADSLPTEAVVPGCECPGCAT